MKLSAPTQPVFIISLVLFIAGLLLMFNVVSLSVQPIYLMIAAYVILAFGNVFKGW